MAECWWVPTSLTSSLSCCHHEAYYWFHWHPHNVTTEWSLTKLRLWQIADSSSYCYIKLTVLHLAEEGGRRSISSSSGHNETQALSWQCVQSYAGQKKSLWIRDFGLRALLMKNICVCVCVRNYILHAATSPCQWGGYHRDGISVNHLLPLLSDCFFSTQLATISSLVPIYCLNLHYSPTVCCHWNSEMQVRVCACLWMCASQRWQWSDLIDRSVEESIRGLLRAPEAACCVLLNLIPLYWRTNWKSVSLSKHSLGWHN